MLDSYGCLVIGSTSQSGGTYRLKALFGGAYLTALVLGGSISGATTITASGLITGGSLSISGAKTFVIDHPTKPGMKLKHRCIESPKAINLYRGVQACVAGKNTWKLPAYFESLNTAAQVWISPADCFGQAFGSVSTDGTNTVTLYCSVAGNYNVLVCADRNDPIAQQEWAEFGEEYPSPPPDPTYDHEGNPIGTEYDADGHPIPAV